MLFAYQPPPITDLTEWLRGTGLLIVLYILGAVLLARFATWTGERITKRIDAVSPDTGDLIRSESAKHSHVLTQVLTWAIIVLIWSVTAVLVLDKLGVPVTGLVAPAAVVGVALGFGAVVLRFGDGECLPGASDAGGTVGWWLAASRGSGRTSR